MMKNETKMFKVATIALAILLLLSLSYIGYSEIAKFAAKRAVNAYQQGFDTGLMQAIITIFQQTNNCQPTSIVIGNQTRFLIDAACIANATAKT